MEYCIKHKLQLAMQMSFLSFGLFTQISPDMIFWSYTWEYPIHLLSKRLLFLSTETWLMIHKTHFPHCGVTVINCFVEPGGLSRESGLVHNCCVRTDTLNPELLSRLKMTHQSSLTWLKSCALFKQASEKDFWQLSDMKNKDYVYTVSPNLTICVFDWNLKNSDWLLHCVSLLFRSDLCIPQGSFVFSRWWWCVGLHQKDV